MYGWSVTHCLPTQMVEHQSAALGTVMRAGTVRELADQAGYAGTEVLPVADGRLRLYRLHPRRRGQSGVGIGAPEGRPSAT